VSLLLLRCQGHTDQECRNWLLGQFALVCLNEVNGFWEPLLLSNRTARDHCLVRCNVVHLLHWPDINEDALLCEDVSDFFGNSGSGTAAACTGH
jgi:hypothetical protein